MGSSWWCVSNVGSAEAAANTSGRRAPYALRLTHARARRAGLKRFDDLDLVRHAGDPIERGDAVERLVALELVVDVALQRDAAVRDLDVEEVGHELGIPHQALQCGAADLGVLAAVAVEQANVDLVVDVD